MLDWIPLYDWRPFSPLPGSRRNVWREWKAGGGPWVPAFFRAVGVGL